ncbi:MAG: guanylate kinase [Gemmatimonadaceae bacterium]|nr:guanylate kinase [Gemmatimonadaceae bacterium]
MNPFPLILSAPSGAGKTTIARELLRARPDVGYSVSCTTRAPRDGEEEGRDYYFLKREEFLERRTQNHFAESADVHGNLYGTLRSEVERVLKSGRHVVMDIDVQGATQFRRSFPDSVFVFVLPPSADVLLQRLRRRGTENRGELAARMISALHELRAVPQYEYVVVNDHLESAVARVSAVIDAEFVRRERVSSLEKDVEALVSSLERELETDLPKE